jgi:hypothetical protein
MQKGRLSKLLRSFVGVFRGKTPRNSPRGHGPLEFFQRKNTKAKTYGFRHTPPPHYRSAFASPLVPGVFGWRLCFAVREWSNAVGYIQRKAAAKPLCGSSPPAQSKDTRQMHRPLNAEEKTLFEYSRDCPESEEKTLTKSGGGVAGGNNTGGPFGGPVLFPPARTPVAF